MAKPVPPLSLIQYFDVPDDYRSGFCWMCGYSADALFLNQAIERFTRETRAQRASRGALSVALMLDPAIQHRAETPAQLQGFDLDGYAFTAAASTPERLVFRR